MGLNYEQQLAEEATGCMGAGDYREWVKSQGYSYLDILNTTSSAGDWDFIVSKDEYEWHVMSQENNWPKRGFTRTIDTSRTYYGTAEEVLQEIWEVHEK